MTGVVEAAESLDRETEAAADNWRLSRIGTVERNILRLRDLRAALGEEPPKVVINEAVQLAHWFAGAKAPAFINGVLDRIAHSLVACEHPAGELAGSGKSPCGGRRDPFIRDLRSFGGTRAPDPAGRLGLAGLCSAPYAGLSIYGARESGTVSHFMDGEQSGVRYGRNDRRGY